MILLLLLIIIVFFQNKAEQPDFDLEETDKMQRSY